MNNVCSGKQLYTMETKVAFDLSEGLRAEIISHIEKNQPEVYWDYNDELSKEHIEQIFKATDGLSDVENDLYDRNIDYIFGLEDGAIKEYLSEFKSKIMGELCPELDEDDFEEFEWEEDFREFCREYIHVDFCMNDLLRRTREQVFFYDTCQEFGDQCFNSAMDKYNDIRRIKKTLGIKTKDYDERIRELLDNASYGGQLVVYFKADVKLLRECMDNTTDKTMITFKRDVSIAITNTGNGSGHDIDIKHEFELPFNPENLFYEDTIKYNYSWEVCGMSYDWCDGTDWGFRTKTRKQRTAKSSLNASIDRDREYKRVYDSGKCTFGDMDYQRHRGITYRNEYPCGSKCPHCGTFFVD